MRMTDLRAGWEVLGNDGRRVGTVREVGQNYLLTSRSAFAPELYVPVTFIANVEEGTIHLNITQRDTDEMGWEQPPRDDDALHEGPEGDLHRHI